MSSSLSCDVNLPKDFKFLQDSSATPGWELVKRLFSRTGFHLCIGQNGDVYSSTDESDKYANLELAPIDTGVVSIKGVGSGLYLGFNEQGRLTGMESLDECCLFYERMTKAYYNVYLNRKYESKDWYIGISKRGRVKNGRKTRLRKKHSHFLPRKAI